MDPRGINFPKVRLVGFFPPTAPQQNPNESEQREAEIPGVNKSSSPIPVPGVNKPFSPIPVPGPSFPPRLWGLYEKKMPVGSNHSSESQVASNVAEAGYMLEEPIGMFELSESGTRDEPLESISVKSDNLDAIASPLESVTSHTPVLDEQLPSALSRTGKSGNPVKVVRFKLPLSSKDMKENTTKAERRALQEAQRAAKAAIKDHGTGSVAVSGAVAPVKTVKQSSQKKGGTTQSTSSGASGSDKKGSDWTLDKDKKKDVPPPRMQFDDKTRVEKAKKRAVVKKTEAKNRVELFRHLPQYEHGSQLPDLESKFFQLDSMHPAVHKVGLKFLTGDIFGGNSRCIAMLQAFQEAIQGYCTPPEKILSRDLTTKINSYVSFLIECRPLSVSMGNSIRFLKSRITKLPETISDSEAKTSLCSDIDRFINEKIILADNAIVKHAITKIKDGDVLLTYGSSCVVEKILINAHELGKKIRVVIVDSRPKLEGQALLRRLVAKGLSCTYTHINAVSYIMHEVTRVFLGASAILSNGTLYSRVGTACVAMVAHAFQVPVIVCCEAYKFHERVQLDSICSNELGDPDAISKVPARPDVDYLDNLVDKENLQLLNLMYDATPEDYVSMIITDYGMVPTTSVAVIVREYGREHLFT